MTAPAPAPPQTALCSKYVGATRIRATLVDSCGRPVYGPSSSVTSAGFTTVELEPEVQEGEDYSQATAGGELCISEKGPDSIKWWTVTITFCAVDPDLFTAMNRSWRSITNYERTQRTGWRMGQQITDQLGFALELWPKSAGGEGQSCDPDGTAGPDTTFGVTGYMLLPWVIANAPDTLTFENAPVTWTLKGRTKAGSLWGYGPYDVMRDETGAPAPLLDRIDPGFDVPQWNFVTSGDPDLVHVDRVTLAPPNDVCGAQPLYRADAVAPQITVTADAANGLTANLTVGNFDAIGSTGTVNWGDGTVEPLLAASNGTATHTYAAGTAGTAQTVTFTPGNGAAPATATFTPNA